MFLLEKLKTLENRIKNNTYTIDDLKDMYEYVNTESEVIVAQEGKINHYYYRNKDRTVSLEQALIPYEEKIICTESHNIYPLDLCLLTFYDEITNRYGQGIIIPRIKKFVMIDDMDLIQRPTINSFYTKGIRENYKECGSIVDLKGNIYRMYGYDEDNEDFTFSKLKLFLFPQCLYQPCGVLIHYKDRPIYADIEKPPYLVFDRETLRECRDVTGVIGNISNDCIRNFDESFMQGKRYVKRRN